MTFAQVNSLGFTRDEMGFAFAMLVGVMFLAGWVVKILADVGVIRKKHGDDNDPRKRFVSMDQHDAALLNLSLKFDLKIAQQTNEVRTMLDSRIGPLDGKMDTMDKSLATIATELKLKGQCK